MYAKATHARKDTAYSKSELRDYFDYSLNALSLPERAFANLADTLRIDPQVMSALSTLKNPVVPESSEYGPTARLLQLISHRVATDATVRVPGANLDEGIVFATGTRTMSGAYLGDDVRTDYSSWMVHTSNLAELVNNPAKDMEHPPISCRTSVDQDRTAKSGDHSIEQIKRDSVPNTALPSGLECHTRLLHPR